MNIISPQNEHSDDQPLVSVICLCYNHEKFVREAVNSILNQSYKNIEITIVDDASTDNSASVILDIINHYPEIHFIGLKQNIGNCRAFNYAFARTKGAFIIDLAADDVLLPERIALGVETFQKKSDQYGVHFTDAAYIDDASRLLRYHYERESNGNLKAKVPVEDVYKEVLSKYFICPPTFMARRQVFEHLGGYDESLAYEDFDFFVRSARKFKFCFTDKVLVHKRVLPGSLSEKQYLPESSQLLSTYYICEKAYILNKTEDEHIALKKRIRYELTQALVSKNYNVAQKFLELYDQYPSGKSHVFVFFVKLLVWLQPDLSLIQTLRTRGSLSLSK